MRKSVMVHKFSEVPKANIPRSSFDRSFSHKTAFDGGLLIPIFVDEALPGDTFNLSMTGFARLATPIFPIMDNMFMETFFFAVPHRLLWDNWQKFCGEQDDPGDSIDFTIPTLASAAPVLVGEQLDYLGIPVTGDITDLKISALPSRALALIWNEWFRDQNLQNSLNVPTDNGPDDTGDLLFRTLQRRGKRHDYFTSCLPAPQKGASVALPLGTSAPITGLGWETTWSGPSTSLSARETGGITRAAAKSVKTSLEDLVVLEDTGNLGFPFMHADLTNATAATINQLRQAFQIQKVQERDARGGTRYTEIIRSHFGVTSPDSRLQRPEFLGGGSSPVQISAVANTSATATEKQGELAAYGTVVLHNHGFTKSFTEHCVLIGLVSVRADLTYSQGVNRMFSRQTRFDYYWPALAQIGEQSVLNREIWADGSANDALVFGYQERYGEYRYHPSLITGIMRSDAAGSLDAWHLSQDFATLPVLNASFIEDNPPIDRVIAVPAEPHFIFDSYFDMRCARPMPLYGVPGMIDHF